MFEFISLVIAIFGSSLAAAFDLKITPTEIPDEIPHAMIASALILAFLESIAKSNYSIFFESLLHGILLLSFGYLMYKFGQWGGGDAKVLAAIGFFSPLLSNFAKNLVFPFVFSYLVNVFVVGAAYMLLYAFVLAILNKKIMHEFSKSVKANSKMILISSPILFFIFFSLNFYLFKIFGIPLEICSLVSNSVLILALSFAFLLIWIFVKCVENVAFKKKIPVTKLKPGDVSLESKVWEGLTREEVKKIKASGKKFVWIKEGVRFAPTFPLALILTLLYGDFLIALLF